MGDLEGKPTIYGNAHIIVAAVVIVGQNRIDTYPQGTCGSKPAIKAHMYYMTMLKKRLMIQKSGDHQLIWKISQYLQGGPPTSYNWVYNSYN